MTDNGAFRVYTCSQCGEWHELYGTEFPPVEEMVCWRCGKHALVLDDKASWVSNFGHKHELSGEAEDELMRWALGKGRKLRVGL